MKKILFPVLIIALFTACSTSEKKTEEASTDQAIILKVDGSSTVYPITEAVAEDYKATNPNLQVTIGIAGTGGGMKKFTSGEIDICNASRPMKKEEMDICMQKNIKFIELPIAYDGLAVTVNPKNTWVDKLTIAELKMIWEAAAQGKIMNWSQVRKGFPDKAIKLFGPGTDSGTFDYFTEAVMGKKGDSRGDYTASEDDNVLVQGVSSDEGALGYFGLAYYEENAGKLKLVPVDDGNDANGSGAISPSMETVQNGTYAPLSRVLLIYANTTAEGKKEVKDFLNFYVEHAPELSKEVGYIPLQENLYTLVAERLQNDVTGSIYTDGKEVGTKLEELLKATPAAQ
ncbi:MAG TPA: PstS family phosphate ABC transporter substrate-binding protein [Chitinophagales bacterium]|nr:PstS family phosphate ABC transporter substrate-binding protein [Chitinophagales bacterium]